MTTRSIAILCVLCVGCASQELSLNGQVASDAMETDISFTTTNSDTAPPIATPTHYTIGGTLVIETGEINVITSILHFEYTNPDPLLAGENPLCQTNHTLIAAVREAPPAEEDLYGWWQIDIDVGADCSEVQYPGPLGFHLGFGPYDPQLDPAAISDGFVGTDIYGLYLQLEGPDDPLLVFGLAGTTDNFDGVLVPVTEAPIPDGAYTLETLYLLPLDSS